MLNFSIMIMELLVFLLYPTLLPYMAWSVFNKVFIRLKLLYYSDEMSILLLCIICPWHVFALKFIVYYSEVSPVFFLLIIVCYIFFLHKYSNCLHPYV